MIALFLAVKRLETATHCRSLIPALAPVSVSTILFLKEFSCSVSVSVCLCAFLFVGSPVCLCAVCLCVRLSICRLSLCPSVYVQSFFVSVFLCAACLCDRLSLSPSVCVPAVLSLSVCFYVFFSVLKIADILFKACRTILAHSDILYK